MLADTYFARKINETETVTSGLCYTEELIFYENSIVDFENLWMFSQPIVQ